MGRDDKLPERPKPSEGSKDSPKIKNPTLSSTQRKPVPKSVNNQQSLSSLPVNRAEDDLPPCYERHESEIQEALLDQTRAASIEPPSVGSMYYKLLFNKISPKFENCLVYSRVLMSNKKQMMEESTLILTQGLVKL